MNLYVPFSISHLGEGTIFFQSTIFTLPTRRYSTKVQRVKLSGKLKKEEKKRKEEHHCPPKYSRARGNFRKFLLFLVEVDA